MDDQEEKLAAAGVFFYSHREWDNAAAGPYDRMHAPATPLPGHQVPRGLLKEMVSFDGRFAETEKLQPLEHWPSEAWGAAWIATDGTSVHCIPGHEAEYAAEIDELEGANGGQPLTFDPPTAPSAPPSAARALATRRWWEFWKK